MIVLLHFLSNEACSKLITRYFHMVGDAYLRELLSALLITIGKRRKKLSKDEKESLDFWRSEKNKEAVRGQR